MNKETNMRKFLRLDMLLIILLFAPLFVLAQVVPPPDPGSDPGGFLSLVLAAIQGRQWIVLAGLVVVGVVYVLRTYGSKWLPWLATARGGAVLSLIIGVLGSVALALLGGKFSWKAIIDGILLALFSSGGYTVVKKIITPEPAPTPPTP